MKRGEHYEADVLFFFDGHPLELRLYQLAGQTKGYLYLPDGTCYALEPTAPLLEFVKARI